MLLVMLFALMLVNFAKSEINIKLKVVSKIRLPIMGHPNFNLLIR